MAAGQFIWWIHEDDVEPVIRGKFQNIPPDYGHRPVRQSPDAFADCLQILLDGHGSGGLFLDKKSPRSSPGEGFKSVAACTGEKIQEICPMDAFSKAREYRLAYPVHGWTNLPGLSRCQGYAPCLSPSDAHGVYHAVRGHSRKFLGNL